MSNEHLTEIFSYLIQGHPCFLYLSCFLFGQVIVPEHPLNYKNMCPSLPCRADELILLNVTEMSTVDWNEA